METSHVICPTCLKQVIPVAAADGVTCPVCGTTLGARLEGRSAAAIPSATNVGMTWGVLLMALLAPAALTCFSALAKRDDLSVGLTFLGSLGAALFGAIWLASRLDLSVAARIGLAIVFAAVFYVGCVALSFAGCAMGGGIRLGG